MNCNVGQLDKKIGVDITILQSGGSCYKVGQCIDQSYIKELIGNLLLLPNSLFCLFGTKVNL